jgi:hypothetical protein
MDKVYFKMMLNYYLKDLILYKTFFFNLIVLIIFINHYLSH